MEYRYHHVDRRTPVAPTTEEVGRVERPETRLGGEADPVNTSVPGTEVQGLDPSRPRRGTPSEWIISYRRTRNPTMYGSVMSDEPLSTFSRRSTSVFTRRSPGMPGSRTTGALFFGCLHQGGLVPGLKYLEQVVHAPVLPGMPTHYTLLFTHTYMPPQHLLHLPGLESSVEVVDMGGNEDWVLCQALNNLTRQPACHVAGGPWLCRLFVVTPGTTRHTVEKCSFPLKNETLMFPHLTLEDPPVLSSLLSGAWKDHLSLHIMELEQPLPKIQL
ncbi:Hypothetical predicted protein [Marmota monax]|uniref:Uncharacterized protein n=1 Tax=Marmota monax TaxID=9995 RepID=A0A5E4BUI6_MARMO|nr:Hypothetical predicted protein [Marmota monax]